MKIAIESAVSRPRDPLGERPVRGRFGVVFIGLGVAANLIWVGFLLWLMLRML
jgi:hypothetical protein